MTEDEAKTKWCPMVRLMAHDGRAPDGHDRVSPASNRVLDALGKKVALNPIDARCIASDCMMWRKAPVTQDPDEGFCGLAGTPLILP